MLNCSETTLARLFGGKQQQLSDWVGQTEARAAASVAITYPPCFSVPSQPSVVDDKNTLSQLCASVDLWGFALYQWSDAPANIGKSTTTFLQKLSLKSGDQGVMRDAGELSLLEDLTGSAKGRFPPYQSKAMNWHTDGYYNAPEDAVRCFTLHCVEPASQGGALVLMDDAYLVLALLQDNPELVSLLSHPEAMTLPTNKDEQGHDRPDRTVPVIVRNSDDSITMRFTTRTQNIHWRTEATRDAAQRAVELIHAHPEWHTRILLEKGQGVVTRNVLHAREQFIDAPEQPKRQILRGRYTGLPTLNPAADVIHISTAQQHVVR